MLMLKVQCNILKSAQSEGSRSSYVQIFRIKCVGISEFHGTLYVRLYLCICDTKRFISNL